MTFIEINLTEELTNAGNYPWMNKNTLIAYLNSVIAAHFRWAFKECKKPIWSEKES